MGDVVSSRRAAQTPSAIDRPESANNNSLKRNCRSAAHTARRDGTRKQFCAVTTACTHIEHLHARVRTCDLELSRERDETAAPAEAARDLIRLDRYERRGSRQKRAIRAFMNIKLMKLPRHGQSDF